MSKLALRATRNLRLSTLCLAVVATVSLPALAVKPVTWDDIANDAKTTEDVLSYGLGLTAQRYSPLKTLTPGTLPAWCPHGATRLVAKNNAVRKPRRWFTMAWFT